MPRTISHAVRSEALDSRALTAASSGGGGAFGRCSPSRASSRRVANRWFARRPFGGLLNAVIKEIYLHVAQSGRPLDPPLLIVLDEAGNTPLRSLPEYASTLAGLGVVLVTIWQSLGQIEANYPRQSDTILNNHATKLFFAGQADMASLRYLAQVLGEVEVETRSRSIGGRQSNIQHSTTKANLVPAHAVRQMRPGDALLLHGTLPPAHVSTVPHRSTKRRPVLGRAWLNHKPVVGKLGVSRRTDEREDSTGYPCGVGKSRTEPTTNAPADTASLPGSVGRTRA